MEGKNKADAKSKHHGKSKNDGKNKADGKNKSDAQSKTDEKKKMPRTISEEEKLALKNKMLSFREVLKKQQKKLQSPDMSPEHTSANTIGSKHRNNRVATLHDHSRIMADHQEMMRQLALDIPHLPFILEPEDTKMYEEGRAAAKQMELSRARNAEPNFDEIITEAENIRRTEESIRVVQDCLLHSIMDILNLVEVIIHKFETVAIGQFDAVKLADAETVDRHVHFGAGGSASTSTKTKPSTSAK